MPATTSCSHLSRWTGGALLALRVDSQRNVLGRKAAGLGARIKPLHCDTFKQSVELPRAHAKRYEQLQHVWKSVVETDKKLGASPISTQARVELIRSQPLQDLVLLVKSSLQSGGQVSNGEALTYGQALKEAQEAAVLNGGQLHDVRLTIASLLEAGLDREDATVLAVTYADLLVERLSGVDDVFVNKRKQIF